MRTFTRAGLTFDVRDTAPTARTRPGGAPRATVVCLHGFPQDGSAYDDVVPLLAAEGLRVLVPDQRGYSPGARPRGRRPYVLRELVDDVVALLDAAGVEAAHVVGHDWGGAVGWAMAGRRARRTLSLTALSTPHPAAMRDAVRHSDQARRSAYMLWYQAPRLPERLMLADDAARIRSALRRSGLPEPWVDRYAARLREPGALTAALAWYRALPFSGRFSAGRAVVPTVHVHGERDPYFARHGAAVTSRYVSADFRQVALDAGHWLPETRPHEVAGAVLRVAG